MNEAVLIWQMDQQLKKNQQRGCPAPFTEHVIAGYTYTSLAASKDNLENLSALVDEIKTTLPSGAEIIVLKNKNKSEHVTVSLHGGPESREGTEIRYLGLYRQLLKHGHSIVILNYRGSSGKIPNRQTWKNWSTSIQQDFSELCQYLEAAQIPQPCHLLGVSFGGALALKILQTFPIRRCVVLSPLLDLSHQKERAGKDYRHWFNSRFSKKDYKDFSLKQLIQKNASKVLFITSTKDEVLGNAMNKELNSFIKKNKTNFSLYKQNTAHAPVSLNAVIQRFTRAFEFLTQ